MKPCSRCGLEVRREESSVRTVRVRDSDYDIEHTTAETCAERLRAEVEAWQQTAETFRADNAALLASSDSYRAEVERYRKAIETHRANVWGCPVTRKVGHPEDVALYAALRGEG